MKRAILTGVTLAALVTAGEWSWSLHRRVNELEQRLQEANRRGEMLDRQLRYTARDLGEALERAEHAEQNVRAQD